MIQEPDRLAGPLSSVGDHPLVTIVVASYNQEKFIRDTIHSVLEQDYGSIELIVMDGGSTDRTVEILRSYENEPRLTWFSEPDDGPNDAFNKGLRLAKGDLIGFQLSSDTYKLGAIRDAVQEFATDSQLAFVGGAIREMDEHGHPRNETWRIFDQRHYYSIDEILTLKNYPAEQATFFRRDVAQSINGNGLEYYWLHTFFFLNYMVEASKKGARCLCVPNIWANYRRHSAALSKELATNEAGLTVLLERNLACKDVSKQYKDYLTAGQVRELRRPGYLMEFRYRVGTLRQILVSIPSLLGYFKFGGRPFNMDLRPRGSKGPFFLASFIQAKVLGVERARGTTKTK